MIRWARRGSRARPEDSMKTHRLGTQGLEVGAIGLGCMGMSDFYGPRDEAESIATIHRALDLGVTMLDTADVYGPHTNEELVGRALRGRRRESVVVATKFGIVRGSDPAARGVNGRPEYVALVLRREPEAARPRHDRPLLPAPGGPEDARSRRRSAPWPSSCARARCATSGSPRPRPRRSGGPTPCTRSPPCRASTRSSPATTRRARSPPAASSASASWPTARSVAAS